MNFHWIPGIEILRVALGAFRWEQEQCLIDNRYVVTE